MLYNDTESFYHRNVLVSLTDITNSEWTGTFPDKFVYNKGAILLHIGIPQKSYKIQLLVNHNSELAIRLSFGNWKPWSVFLAAS